MTPVTKCSSEGCTDKPQQSLILRGQPGHVHDCGPHSALVREHCDVIGSCYIIDGQCQIKPCTGDTAIYTAEPTPLT